MEIRFTAEEIAQQLNGLIEGDSTVSITSAARIEQGKKGNLCFLANPKYERYLYTTEASIVVINKGFELKSPVTCTLIRVDNAYTGITNVLGMFEMAKAKNKKGREWPSRISWWAKKGKNCYIGAFVYIARKAVLGNNVKVYPSVYIGEGVIIGENTILYPGVKIYAGCQIGANCIIHSGAIIGSDGFGFAPQDDKTYKKIPQTGNVIIEDWVEIGANTTIDRATMGSTIIKSGVKLDNLIQIAHNVEVDSNTVMAAQSGIAGSSKVGRNCVIGGQVAISGHIKVGDFVSVGGKSGLSNNVPDHKKMFGTPAIDASKQMRCYAVFRNLPELRAEVTELKKQMSELTKQ